MARKSNNDGIEVLSWMLTIAFMLTIGLIIGIVKLIISLTKWIISLFDENNLKNKKEYNNTNLRYIEQDKNIEINFQTPYDSLFNNQIKKRGTNYYLNNKIVNYNFGNNISSADIIGTAKYKTTIEFYKNKKIKKMTCDCPYFLQEKGNCKHMYALLLKYLEEQRNSKFDVIDISKKKNKLIKSSESSFENEIFNVANKKKEEQEVNLRENIKNNC